MTAVAIALLATLPFTAAAWLAGAAIDRLTPSPVVRERVHTLAFLLPLIAAPIPLLALLFPRAVLEAARLPSELLPSFEAVRAAAPEVHPTISLWNALLDHGAALFLGLATLGALVGLARLVQRHRALAAAMKAAAALDREDVTQALRIRAEALDVPAPRLAVSDSVSTPVLVGLRRPAILIPTALAGLPAERLMLVCGHELAHVRHRDNARLLAEDILLALLWFNPLQATVHRRLLLAREEARDAFALTGAGPETRRHYAETLMEILRLGAGPGLAAAFIGTGREGTAMRLKAILKPRGPASRAHKLAAAAIALSLLAGAGAGSLAIAAQAGPEERTTARITGLPVGGGFKVVSDYIRFGHPAERRIRWIGAPKITFDRPGDYGGTVFLVDGAPAPAGFRPEAVDPKTLAWIEGRKPLNGDEWPMTLDLVSVSPKTKLLAKYETADAVDYQRFCTSGDPQDTGFCAGVIFGVSRRYGCLPEGFDRSLAPDRVIPVIAAAKPKPGDSMFDLARSAVAEAFPCPANG